MTSSRFELPTTGKGDLADAIANAKFVHVRMRAGYNQDDVDNYLDELEELIRAGAPLQEIKGSIDAALFNTTRVVVGYDVDDVDEFLDEVVAAAAAVEPSPLDLLAAHYAAEAPAPRPANHYDFSAPAPPVPPLAEVLAENSPATPADEGERPLTRRELRRRREEAAAREAAEAAAED